MTRSSGLSRLEIRIHFRHSGNAAELSHQCNNVCLKLGDVGTLDQHLQSVSVSVLAATTAIVIASCSGCAG
jgi:hypothetical protein